MQAEVDPRPETDPCTVTIDGLRLTPCWRYKTKEYVIGSIVGSSRRGGLTLSLYPKRLIANQELDKHVHTLRVGGWRVAPARI